MYIVCSDLEGVFIPEIWINVAQHTGIEKLKLTTRDISDYDVLMKGRIEVLKQNRITLSDIQSIIARMEPLPGAVDFLDWLRSKLPTVIVSDTFHEFADPVMVKLNSPTLLCHHLTTDSAGMITGYNLRQHNAKQKVAQAFQNLNYKVIATGDSYNDLAMLRQADASILYRPPQNVAAENTDIPIAHSYEELKETILRITGCR
ncbi:MAG: bifunctional phosphoserine phosphatase/homoserine phosphotransferase ThrH [Bacteroidales bacterium]|jgi:phosphoserine/homoserine phosphotransferase|nr:bifunctional phosphoserine phosphatase/homoserine phosphotransferase ThrH [Bacteroidales bacterium]